MHIETICEGRSGYIAACVCLDCVPGEPVILEAPAPIAPAPDELSMCYAMHPGMKCDCKGVELRCFAAVLNAVYYCMLVMLYHVHFAGTDVCFYWCSMPFTIVCW